MPYEVEETGDLTRLARVSVPSAEYRNKVNKALKQLSGRVKVKGFRKGHIPLSVMHQRYGEAVTREVIEELVQKHIKEVLDESENVLHLGRPTITGFPEKGSGALEFELAFELRPNVDPIGYMGIEVEKPDTTVSNEDIEAYLAEFQEKHATLEPIEHRNTIESGDVVTVDFKALGEHPELEKLQGTDADIEVGAEGILPGIGEALEGAKFGSTIEAQVTADENFPIEELRGQEIPIRLDIKAVKQRVLPEIDDDFAQRTGEAETLLELRANVRKEIEGQREHQAMHMAEDNLMERLLEANDFELPPLFLEEQLTLAAQQRLNMLQSQGIDFTQLGLDINMFKDDIRNDVVSQIKAEFLLSAIAAKEGIEVEEADMKAYFEHRAAHAGVPANQIEAYMRQDRDRWSQATGMALLEKTKTHLLKDATITVVEWPDEEEEVFDKEEGSASVDAEEPDES